MTKTLSILAFATLLLLGACSSQSDVKGTGSGTDDYKASPCACNFQAFPPMPRVTL